MNSVSALVDLPDELLLLILDRLDPNALLYLAMLCKRLHYISLPMYLLRNAIANPAERADCVMLDSRRDPLSALQMALFIPHITELSCSLPPYETSIHHLFPHVRRLRVLVARLAFVRKLTLELDTPSGRCGDTGEHVEAWALEFRELLLALLQRGCVSLTLRYGRLCFSSASEAQHARHVVGPVNVLRNAVRHILPLTPKDDWGALACSSSMLTHFNIESSMLLLPPYLSYSLSVIQHSPITSLTLDGITLPTKVWSAVLPSVASLVPTLASLALSNLYGISGTDILLFTAKLPRLQTLTIGYTEYSRSIQSAFPDSGPVPKLPELTDLHAPSTFIVHLLKKRGGLPRLAALCITPRRLILGVRGLRQMARAVADIVRRLDKRALAPAITLALHRARDTDAEMAADLAMVLPPAAAAELARALRAVTRLVVYSDAEMGPPELGTLARWIARFPALVHISLRVRGHEEWATRDTARAILAQQSSTVRSLELNGKLFDVHATRNTTVQMLGITP